MKLALIPGSKGTSLVDFIGLSYHLVLAQHVLADPKYEQFYKERHDQGDFILMDNGAAEEGTLSVEGLMYAARMIHPDEIILPDHLCDADATIKATMDENVLALIPPRKRAVVPQGNTIDEWLTCANYLVDELEFTTLCIPKHAERFPGGRVSILNAIHKLNWHNYYNIHMLGIWGDPYHEPRKIAEAAPWVRGLDTAAPFAFAQAGLAITSTGMEHISHSWNGVVNKPLVISNVDALLYAMRGDE